ncbi:unnamed protein product [Dracunculus medinensis]|uniref:Vacuolar protein sorting-associated protein 35 n=1 Tax=Dracunculus medinensis TaxID=318479 RepID=A0A0N4ULX5_DRAME|nr:unnamed protein product [Dracunculus medinensis]
MAGDEDTYLSSTEQEKILDESTRIVKSEAFEMKRCLDKNLLMDGIKHASLMLSEMRTDVDVTNELQHLEAYLSDEYEKGRQVNDLYELVQYAGNVVPRMYLLITVGVVYIKSGEGNAKTILKDLVEMCRGVQHPLRGLFLRNYLLQCTRNLLPDLPDTSECENGNVKDAIDFIMVNFSEMNKLWVRMQHQGPSRERDKRERERRELRILVGTNLVRLSQLENITIETYQKVVLPGILEQSVSCKDPISQEYLMECVIQVFPDEYHLATLHEFLNACTDLHQAVQIKNVLIALIDRLAIYATCEGCEIPADMPLFDIFSKQTESVITSRQGMLPEDIVSLQMALLNFALKCYPHRLDFANIVLETTCSIFERMNFSKAAASENSGRELLRFLRIPVDQYHDTVRLLQLSKYRNVINLLDYRGRTQACAYVINDMVENDVYLSSQESVEELLNLIEPLLVDQDDQPDDLEKNEEFADEQSLVARLVNLIHAETADQQFIFLNQIRKRFGNGGRYRIRYTLPTVVFAVYQLIIRYSNECKDDEKWNVKLQKMLLFCMTTIGALVTNAEMASIPLNLYLQAGFFSLLLFLSVSQRTGALIADKVNFDNSSTVAYEFMSKAFSLYEEAIPDSRGQLVALNLIIGTLQKLHCFTEENHSPLRTQCAHASTKLLKKIDQCTAVCSVAHLFWSGHIAETEGPMHDSSQVVACLKKASRVVSQCMEPLVQIQYSITVLNHYLYFYEDKCGQVDLKIYWIYKNISMIQLMMEFFHILHLPVIRFQIFN